MLGSDKPMFFSNMLTAIDHDDSYPTFPHPNEDMEGAEKAYMLEPDWTQQFKNATAPAWIRERVANHQAETPLKSVEPTWMDGEPTLWQSVPPSLSQTSFMPAAAPSAASQDQEDRLKAMDQKLDRMFAKLEEINSARAESNHLEIIMFILGGLFLLLMLDMLVKQGVRATAMIAATAGGALQGHMRLA